MKEILEYRKASAGALELQVETSGKEGIFYFPETLSPLTRWHPDKDANQMLMVWEWLREREDIQIDLYADIVYFELLEGHSGNNKDIKLATMKSFMKYWATRRPTQKQEE